MFCSGHTLRAGTWGEIGPRRAKCATDVDRKEKGHPPFGIFTAGDLAAARTCDQEQDCKVRVACGSKVLANARKRAQR